MTRFNSLLGSNKFPVPMRRELARKSLNLALDSEPTIHSGAPANKIPCIFPASREFGFGDEFAQDCLLQGRVRCEPDFGVRHRASSGRVLNWPPASLSGPARRGSGEGRPLAPPAE